MADAPAEQPAEAPQAPDEALLRELHGTLSAGSRERIVEAWNERGGLLTDVFLELGVATETQFLRYFAVKYATRFILAEKLAPAAVEDRVRDLVPVRVAERLGLVPLFYDEREKQLTVVAAVPLHPGRLTEVRRLTKAEGLVFYVATWPAVRAAIRKHYYRDPDAFSVIKPNGAGPPPPKPRDEEPEKEKETERTRVLYASDTDMLLSLRQENARFRIAQAFHQRVRPERELGRQLDRILAVVSDLLASDTAIIRLEDGTQSHRSRIPNPDLHIPSSLYKAAVASTDGVLRNGIGLRGDDVSSESVVLRGVKSALVVPLKSGDESLGVLYLESLSSPAAFDENDRALLSAVGAQAAAVIHNSMLLDQVEREAKARTQLSRFLAPELVDQAVEGSLDLQLEGRSAVVTALYADIRGFTQATDRLGAAEVVRLLTRFYDEMTEVVFAQGGMVDKFMGDCVMAVWGAPIPRADHAARALRAAAAMVRRSAGLTLDSIPLGIGVGVATGEVVMGAVGSDRRLDYTVIGPAVNVAARLCDLAGAGEVWLTDAALEASALALVTEDLGQRDLKGVATEISIHRMVAPFTGLSAPRLRPSPAPGKLPPGPAGS